MSSKISLPTGRDRDLGLVLLFLSAVFYFIVPPLAREFGVAQGMAALIATPIGLILMVLGIAGTFFSRKIIEVEENIIKIRDGLFARPMKFRHHGEPSFKLSGYEQEGGSHSTEIWTVHMQDEGKQYLIDRRAGQQMASRSLAERLAKGTRAPLIEVQEGKNYTFSVEELDLSFVERVNRHPEMLGPAVEEPSDSVVNFQKFEDGIKVSWGYFRSNLLFELFCVSAFLVAAAFIPIPGGPRGRGFSLFDAEMAEGDYRYFIGVAIFFFVSLFLLAGYRSSLELITPKRAESRSSIWGIPVRSGRIPLDELEHITVTVTGRGPYLQLISDRKILRERMPATNIARWLAWEFRRHLAQLAPKDTEVEQSVEMTNFWIKTPETPS